MRLLTPVYHLTNEQLKQEDELIALAKKDPSRFDVLYTRYFQQIFMYALKRVETEEIAADITSQVFLKALLGINKFNSIGLPFSSWLYRIARNEIYDQYSRKKINIVVSIESQGIWDIITEIADEQIKEDFTKLNAAIRLLPEEDIELIELRYFEKRPFREIGEVLNITENNAKVRTYRVLDKLKNLIGK